MTPTIIGICGPTSTGKTSLAIKAVSSFEGMTHIAMDDFYKDLEDAPLSGDIPNWDTPASVRFDELEASLKNLKKNVPAHVPIYSKPHSKRVGGLMAHPTPFILVEGTMIYSSPIIRDLCSLKIFVRTTADTILDHYKYRKKDYSIGVRYLTELVIPNLNEYTEHYSPYADIILDGTKSFEDISSDLFANLTQYITSIHSS